MINANSDVNGYWTITNNTATIPTYSSTFNFNNNDLDASAVPTSFQIQQYDGISWNNTTVSSQLANSTAFTGEAAFGTFAVGNMILSSGIYNAVTGAMNWSLKSNWIQYEAGTISSSALSNIVTGVGTIFYNAVKSRRCYFIAINARNCIRNSFGC